MATSLPILADLYASTDSVGTYIFKKGAYLSHGPEFSDVGGVVGLQYTVSSLLQSKADAHICVTLSGMVTLISDVHILKLLFQKVTIYDPHLNVLGIGCLMTIMLLNTRILSIENQV